ncbi:MAG: two-component regulator propeller domain-containing protein, partial [Thermoanaerobaculia bacterium]
MWTIYQDRAGAVWIGTNNGLSRLAEDGSMTHYRVADGLPGLDVRSLLEDRDGNLWIGTETDGLARLRGDEITSFTSADGLAGNGVFVMLEDSRGGLWFGTDGGLSRLRDGRFQTLTVADGLSHDRIWSLHEDSRGTLWIGTDNGLTRFDGEELTPIPLPAPDIVKTITGEADGTLWIGTAESGLLHYRDGRFVAFSVDQGLFDHLVHRILDDGRGWMWMSSNQGLFRVSKTELEDVAAGRTDRLRSISYGEDQGMRSRECNGGGHPAGIRTRDGRLWFPTIQGVVIVDPERLTLNRVPPPVHLETVLADGLDVDPRAAPAVLPPRTRELQLDYVALSFLDSDKIAYRYRLRGFDSDWVEAGTRRSAYYTNLDPGNYTFQVIAANSDGTWNEDGDSLEIRLRPAFYQTWAFYLVCALATVLLGRGIHVVRVRQLVRRNRLLEQNKTQLELKNAEIEAKSAEMERFTYAVSHDLKAPLVTIRGFLGMVRQDLAAGRTDRTERDLERIDNAAERMARLLGELLQLSRIGRVVQEPQEISMTELAREAADLVGGRIAERGVDLDVDADMPTFVGDRERLLEVLQNLIDNAVKFMGDQPRPRIRVGWRRDGDDPVCGDPVCGDPVCGDP